MFKNYHRLNESNILHSKTFPLPITIESELFRFCIKLKSMMFTRVNKTLKYALNIYLNTGKICSILMPTLEIIYFLQKINLYISYLTTYTRVDIILIIIIWIIICTYKHTCLLK